MNRTLAVLGTIMVATAVVISGCDDDGSEEEATSSFCSDLDALGDALGAYADLSVDSTIEEVEDAQSDVAEAYDAVQDSSVDVAEARLDDLETAYDDLAGAVDDLSGEDTVGEAITTIAAYSQQVEAARADVVSSANCAS